MPAETILIVEDAPESLKFAASTLRSAGYKVQIASTAEQAMSTLRFLKPQLMLVDFILPGMSGLELTTRVKQDPRLQDTIVVALTGCAMPGDEARARQAGCDGYLTKPIDARSLAARVRQFLEPDTAPASKGVTSEGSPTAALGIPDEELEELRESFLRGGKGVSRQLLTGLEGAFDDVKAARTVHQWVGTAGLLNFTNVAYRARDVEQALRTPGWTVAGLRGPLTNLARSFHSPEASEAPSQATARALDGKRIALVGLSNDEADRMCGAMELVGARARLFEAVESPRAETIGLCHLAVMHVRTENRSSEWLDRNSTESPIVPTLFLGAAEDLLALSPEVQTRATGLLTEGSLPGEILMRFRLAISMVPAEPRTATAGEAEILIADTDESSCEPARSLLQELGLPCRVAASGADAIVLLHHVRPRVVVVDAETDGFEVLATIRTDSLPIRSLFLTTDPREDQVLRGLSLGAEDYLERPFSPMELVARVKRLAAG